MRCVASSLTSLGIAVGLSLGASIVHAEPVKLEDVEQRAVQNRATLLAARSRVDTAEARVDLAKVPYYPTLSARVGADAAPGGRLITVRDVGDDPNADPYTVSGSRTIKEEGAFIPNFRYEGTVALQSRLYDFGRTAASVRAARADRDASLAGVRAERQAVVTEARAAYLAWLSAFGTWQILAESANDSTALRASVEAHVAEGSRPGAELSAARYDEARAALDLDRSESELSAARIDVELAMGAPLPKAAEPDLALLDRAPASAPPSVHPDVALLERRRDAATAVADSHGYAHAPVVAVAANAGLSGQTTSVFPLYHVGLSVTLPILDGGAESASVAAATAQASELTAQARELRGRVNAGTERSRIALERGARRLALTRKLVLSAEQAVRHAEDQQQIGSGSFDEVVQAKIRLSRAKLEVLSARLERTRALLDLTAASR